MLKKLRATLPWAILFATVTALFGPAVYAGTTADIAKQVYDKWSSGEKYITLYDGSRCYLQCPGEPNSNVDQ